MGQSSLSEIIKRTTEIHFTHASGPGGQNVNARSTKVQLHFDISSSQLNDLQKSRLMQAYPEGFLQVSNQHTRYQHRNTDLAFDHLLELIQAALLPTRRRKAKTAPHLTRTGKLKKMLNEKIQKYRLSKWRLI